jgi:hypothetical protein
VLNASPYTAMLLELTPRLVEPGGPGDYFREEQVATWGADAEHATTPYYRGRDLALAPDEHWERHLFELVVPMLPPSWNDPARAGRPVQLLALLDTEVSLAGAAELAAVEPLL